MRHVIFVLLILNIPLFNLTDVWASYEVLDISLSPSIKDRVPINPVSPKAYCEKDKNGKADLPVIKTPRMDKIFFWTRIASTTKGTIRHTWHHYSEDGWKTISKVDLSIRPSSGYRMWSSKTLRTDREIGDWMIVVSPSNNLKHILCITRFSVQ